MRGVLAAGAGKCLGTYCSCLLCQRLKLKTLILFLSHKLYVSTFEPTDFSSTHTAYSAYPDRKQFHFSVRIVQNFMTWTIFRVSFSAFCLPLSSSSHIYSGCEYSVGAMKITFFSYQAVIQWHCHCSHSKANHLNFYAKALLTAIRHWFHDNQTKRMKAKAKCFFHIICPVEMLLVWIFKQLKFLNWWPR